MIKMQVIGNLGKDCVVNTVNGKNVINFTVAHTEKYKDSQGNNQEKTTWVDCAYWTDRTAVAPYLQKGQQVYVEGTPEVRSFTRNDGTAGASLSMRVREVQLLGRKGDMLVAVIMEMNLRMYARMFLQVLMKQRTIFRSKNSFSIFDAPVYSGAFLFCRNRLTRGIIRQVKAHIPSAISPYLLQPSLLLRKLNHQLYSKFLQQDSNLL